MNFNLKQAFAPILRWWMRDNPNIRAEMDIVALPLTHHELTVVMRCLELACESERTDAAEKQTVGLIRERVWRFAERQGAWWDLGGALVGTVIKIIAAPDVAKPLA
jgi:hypothetical protein